MTKEENIVARLTVITLDALRDHKPIAVSTARDALDLLNDQAVAYKKLEAENARWRELVKEIVNGPDIYGEVLDIDLENARAFLNPTSAGGLYDE